MTKLDTFINNISKSLIKDTYNKRELLNLINTLNEKKSSNKHDCCKNTITLTLGDSGENHIGMEVLGDLGDKGSGYSIEDLLNIYEYYKNKEVNVEYHDISIDNSDKAGIIIIRNYLDVDKSNVLYEDLFKLKWDRHYKCHRRKQVLNKHARANLMIQDGYSQEPDYENSKGTIIDGNTIDSFKIFKKEMVEKLNIASNTDKADNLICEGNLYFDQKKCGIGYHGDAERRKVIAIRLGESMCMNWQWFHRNKPVEKTFEFVINSGDLYMMSEKAVGNDWKKSSLLTLRHAAGSNKFTNLDKYKCKI